MKFVKTTGRIIDVDKIPYALVYPDQTLVYPVDYHAVTLTGDDAQRMNAALKEAGFVGDGTLINPNRISVIEDAGVNKKVYLEGADRVAFIANETIQALLAAPAVDFPAMETIPSLEKPRRKKASE